MPLTPGTRLGLYEILSPLGAGGMGEVYKARDPKLDRMVAIKVLPEQMAKDADALARFEREAKALAALQHPNVLGIFDFGTENGIAYAVMELLEGETLRDLISSGPPLPRRSLDVAVQIAHGLSAAHGKGIVHRDLKPENIFVMKDGRVRILDFGLAKQLKPVDVNAPTRALGTNNSTEKGMILGTMGYMSPEQVRGEAVDARSDIFSFGSVVFELYTGQRAFARNSAADTMSAIMKEDPPNDEASNRLLPGPIQRIITHCMEKDPSRRFQGAQDLAFALENGSQSSGPLPAEILNPKRRLAWSLPLLISLLLITALAGWWLKPVAAPSTLAGVRLTPLTADPGYAGEPSFFPDGRSIAFVSDRTGNFQIFLKQVGGGADINLSRNSADEVQPSVSPDGKQIAFVSSRSGKAPVYYPGQNFPLLGGDVYVMPALGGNARLVAEHGNSPSWSPDGGTILFTRTFWPASKILKIPAAGGPPQEIPIRFPKNSALQVFVSCANFSPDGHWILAQAELPQTGEFVFVCPAEGGDARMLLEGSWPRWGDAGRSILYSNTERGKNQSLWRAPFSTSGGKLDGPPEPLTVGRGLDIQACMAPDGKSVVFAAASRDFNLEELSFDAETGRISGEPRALTAGHQVTYFQSYSPDGKSVVYDCRRGGQSHIWRLDLGSLPVQLTADGLASETYPRWSPDGGSILFNQVSQSQHDNVPGSPEVWVMRSDGGSPHLAVPGKKSATWLPDGKAVVATDESQRLTRVDLATGQSRVLTDEPGITNITNVSPDGRWVIYQCNVNGQVDLHAVSIEGGTPRSVTATPGEDYHPFVSPSGRWLYFHLNHKNLWRVPGPTQDWKAAEPVQVTFFPESGLWLEDIKASPDGTKLLYSRGHTSSDIWLLNLTE